MGRFANLKFAVFGPVPCLPLTWLYLSQPPTLEGPPSSIRNNYVCSPCLFCSALKPGPTKRGSLKKDIYFSRHRFFLDGQARDDGVSRSNSSKGFRALANGRQSAEPAGILGPMGTKPGKTRFQHHGLEDAKTLGT